MTATVTIPASKFYIAIETSPGSGSYTTPCVFTKKTATYATNLITDSVPQCDTPDGPALVRKFVDSLDYKFAGDGKLGATSLRFWREWHRSGLARGIRIYSNDQTHATYDGGYESGSAILTQFEQSAERGKQNDFSVTIEVDGALTWTDNA